MKIYDSLSRTKSDFRPLGGKEVKMYVCGITPNNATHLGHAFTYVAFDVLNRFLKYSGYAVNYVQNATDVNDSDDVILQANETGKTWTEIADQWIKHFKRQMTSLNVLAPTSYVLASTVMDKIIDMNAVLIKRGCAYIKNGGVYFDVKKLKSYGVLSRFQEEQMLMISRERGNNPDDSNKKNPLDFVLWIPSEGQPNWKSPWSQGRPGWHIECSAMIYDKLGQQIDIHGGGRDLIYPHHESEIAQSECFTGVKPFVKCWMHVGMVMYEGEKMSKSLGNLILVEDLLKKCSPTVVRWFLLSHHYRHPWEFELEELNDSEKKIQVINSKLQEKNSGKWEIVEGFLNDDLDTHELLRYLSNECSGETLKRALDLLGIKIQD